MDLPGTFIIYKRGSWNATKSFVKVQQIFACSSQHFYPANILPELLTTLCKEDYFKKARPVNKAI